MLYNMKRHEGFTLIELLITITIMVILLGLTVVNLRSSQATARDEERKTDVNIIARHLEVFYDSGTDDGATDVLARYPSTSVMDTVFGSSFGSGSLSVRIAITASRTICGVNIVILLASK